MKNNAGIIKLILFFKKLEVKKYSYLIKKKVAISINYPVIVVLFSNVKAISKPVVQQKIQIQIIIILKLKLFNLFLRLRLEVFKPKIMHSNIVYCY